MSSKTGLESASPIAAIATANSTSAADPAGNAGGGLRALPRQVGRGPAVGPGIPRRGRKLGTAAQRRKAAEALYRKLESGQIHPTAARTLLRTLGLLAKLHQLELAQRLADESDAKGQP